MRLAVISDPHLGYAWGSERQEDPFNQAKEAFEKAIESADLILLPGDLFDTRVPKQEIMEKAMRLLSMALDAKGSSIKTIDSFNVSEPSDYTLGGIPVVAIHGNHERRGSMLVNPVETLAAGGLLIHLHLGAIVFEKDGKRVAIHGMSAVPEPQAKDALIAWNPKPIEGAYNILVLHQSFKEMLYEEIAFLEYSDLPKGFDLYVNGHIHWSSVEEKDGKRVLHPGSTVITQMKRREAEEPKGFYFLDTDSGAIDFVALERQRPFFFREVTYENGSPLKIVEEVTGLLDLIPESDPKPQVKLKLKGSLQMGTVLDVKQITDKFKDRMLLAVDDELGTEDFKKKIASLRELHKEKASVLELGMDILKQNLSEAKYEGVLAENIMPILEEGDSDKALEIVMKERVL
ncbi:DNA repair exonuclease [archaeon]|nr:DNA repair exonuclease [archaeon]